MKYLNFYYKCLKSGKIPHGEKYGNNGGLCGVFGNEVMKIFKPTASDTKEYRVYAGGYWGHGDNYFTGIDELQHNFTPTRQNIVLLLAAMNNEL